MCEFHRARTTPIRNPVPSSPAGGAAPVPRPPRHGAGRRGADSTRTSSEALEEVAHALALGAEVGEVLGVDGHDRGDPLGDLEAEALEAAVLGRVVGDDPHRGDAEVDEDLRADAVLPAVLGQPEVEVGVDGVAALLLEAVGADLVPDADAAALVAAEVDDHAAARLGHDLHRRVELHAAVAAQRAEHVTGEALAVHAHEHVVLAGHGAPDHGDVLLAVEERLVGVAGEVAPLGGDAGLGDAADELLVLAAVADEVGDRDHQQAVLVGEPLELGHAGHVGLLVVDDLAEQPGRVEPGHAGTGRWWPRCGRPASARRPPGPSAG